MKMKRTDLYNLVKLGFLEPEHTARLKTAGINDGSQLVVAWRIPAERQRLEQAVRLPMPKLMRAVFVANLLSQTAPGEAGINELLLHPEENIFEFKDTERDHRYVSQNRQGILNYAGQAIYDYQTWSTNQLLTQRRKSYAWDFIWVFFMAMGVIAYNHWDTLFGRSGSDITSQLVQALGRREALKQAGVLGYVSLMGIFYLISLMLTDRVLAWFDRIVDRKMGRTSRDVLVLAESQMHTSSTWVKSSQNLNHVGVFILVAFMLAWLFMPTSRIWIDWFVSVFAFSWMLLKTKEVSVRFSRIGAAWAEQARPRQAGPLLLKEIAIVLEMGMSVMIVFLIAILLQRDANVKIQTQVQAARSELHSWLMQQTLKETDPSLDELEQLVWDRTQSWLGTSQKDNADWVTFLDALHLLSVLVFSMMAGAVLGWFYFIRYQRWINFFLAAAVVYLAFEITPELVAWWLSQIAQTDFGIWQIVSGLFQFFQKVIVDNMFGLTIGLVFALGQEVYNSAKDHDLNYECPNCHVLRAAPSCCDFGQIDKFDKEMPLVVS